MRSAEETRAAIEGFLKTAGSRPCSNPAKNCFPSPPKTYALEMRGSRLTLQAWDRTRNWTRRITAITEATNARLALTVERFARREGQLFLLDLGRRAGAELGKRSGRLVFRERFRLFLRRQFPEWKLAEVSAEADLEHSLSPAFPRAFLRHGQHGWAAIACPPDADAAAVLSLRPHLADLPARPRAPRHRRRPRALRPGGRGALRRAAPPLPRSAIRPLRALHLHRTTIS